MIRALVAAALMTLSGVVVCAAPASAQGCAPTAPPPGAATRPVGPLDGQPATLWVSTDGYVGITGYGSVQVANAGPLPLQAMVIDAEENGKHQLIVSNGRGAHLYEVSACQISAFTDPESQPFLFDMENLRGTGTGIGCSDLGDGRHLVGLQAVMDNTYWTVRRTQINLDGTIATVGRSDSITAPSAQDPAVTSAQTISCGDQTISADGVTQP